MADAAMEPGSSRRAFQIVVAVTEDWGIGQAGSLPFKLPGDMAYFKQLTSATSAPCASPSSPLLPPAATRNAVIMGRKTFESIPAKFRPLAGRLNIVITSAPPVPYATAAAGDGGGAGDDDGAGGAPKQQQQQQQQQAPAPLIRARPQQQQQQQDENRPPLAATDVANSPSKQQQRRKLPGALAGGAASAAAKAAQAPASAQQQGAAGQPGEQQLLYVPSLEAAMQLLEAPVYWRSIEAAFVIGGGQVYADAVASDRCSAIHITRIDAAPECDTHFPDISAPGSPWRVWSAAPPRRETDKASGADTRYQFVLYTKEAPESAAGAAAAGAEAGGGSSGGAAPRRDVVGRPPLLPPGVASRHEELQYLELVQELVESGCRRGDRTGTGTLSKFGVQHRYSLRHTFPLLTTKRVFWKGVVEELLWFIRGSTNAKELADRGVHIWDGNSSRAFLDAQGLGHREEGDLGPVYGFQWRHFGAAYTNMHADYTGQGVDQLAQLVGRIKSNPEDRRLILSAWNPAALHDMALPPCHMMAQFYVADGELSCQLYQRSADVGLGVPFNIASYALLTCMMAQVCGLRRGEFIHVLGDAHVYANHVGPLSQQLSNAPRHLPSLAINPGVSDIDGFAASDFTLAGYAPHKTIRMQMAV